MDKKSSQLDIDSAAAEASKRRQGPLRQAGVSPRTGVRDHGAGLRQDQRHAGPVPDQPEDFVAAGSSMATRPIPRDLLEERAGRGGASFLRRAAPARHRLQHAPGDLAGRRPADSPLRHRRRRVGDVVLFTRHRRLFAHRVVSRIRARSRHAGRRHRRARSVRCARPSCSAGCPRSCAGEGRIRPGSKLTLAGRMTARARSPFGSVPAACSPACTACEPSRPVTAGAARRHADHRHRRHRRRRPQRRTRRSCTCSKTATPASSTRGTHPTTSSTSSSRRPATPRPTTTSGCSATGGRWHLERGDFRAEWDPATRRGRIRQSANPYSIDTVLRIVHTLVLARRGRLPAARGERRAQRQGIPVRRRFGRGQDHDFAPGAAPTPTC